MKKSPTSEELKTRNARFQIYYQKNREKLLARAAENRAANRERNRTYQKEVTRGPSNIEAYRDWDSKNQKPIEFARRLKLLARWGCVCARCGFDDPRALQIDHVRGDGAEDRRGKNGSQYKKHLETAPLENYQVLCANCNWIKRVENEEYRAPKLRRVAHVSKYGTGELSNRQPYVPQTVAETVAPSP